MIRDPIDSIFQPPVDPLAELSGEDYDATYGSGRDSGNGANSHFPNDSTPHGAIENEGSVNCQRVNTVPTQYEPFPVETLPKTIRNFIVETAAAIGCDSAYIALPLLAAIASAIGNTRRIRLKAAWTEPAVLWCIPIGDSGTLKSPAYDAAMQFLRRRQKLAMDDHRKAQAEYLAGKDRFDADLKAWRSAKPNTRGERPQEPAPPVCERILCSDTTVEALAGLLAVAWRGLLLARDEVAGWLASFNQYRNGKGGDVSHWLEMHRAGPMMVDRKTGDKTTLHIPRAAVSIAGGIQPETLRRCLTQEFFDNGLAPRLLLAMPPKRSKRWTEADVDGRTVDAMDKLFAELLSFQPSTGLDGEPEPADVALSDDAKAVWVEFYDRHAQEQSELDGELSAAWSKLEGYAARLALVIHCVRQASGETVDPWRCDGTSMMVGIELADWFGREATRVYSLLAESRDDRDERRLVELIQSKGGSATVRDCQRSSRLYSGAAAWHQALSELVEAGIGRWQYPKPGDAGGQPAKVFHLLAVDALTVDGTPRRDSATRGSVKGRGGK